MRRALDIAAAVLLVLVTAPLLVAVALLVWTRLGSPVLFRQERTGRSGETFTLVKFKSMKDAAYHGQQDIERITRLGHVLRATGFDELPQLWNIVRGDMSFIGPRPALPQQAAHFSARQRGRLSVRPGLTGWAQVNGRNAISWTDRIELDLWYIENRSPVVDCRILARTALRVLRPADVRGADGVNEGFRTETGELIDIWSSPETAAQTGAVPSPTAGS